MVNSNVKNNNSYNNYYNHINTNNYNNLKEIKRPTYFNWDIYLILKTCELDI